MPDEDTSTWLQPFSVVKTLGLGASSHVLSIEQNGQRAALKLARETSRDATAALANEAHRHLLARGRTLPTLLGAGLLSNELRFSETQFPAGTPYLLLSEAPGSPLSEWFSNGSVPRELVHAVARDVAEALQTLHEAGIAHGDVKPSNMMVHEADGRYSCTLLDLGLGTDAELETPIGGTPRYLPPELRGQARETDGRARDIWALGYSLLEALVPKARTSDRVEPFLAELSQPLATVVRGLTEPDPAARPGPSWVSSILGDVTGHGRVERARCRIRQSYLLSRSQELQRVERGHRARITTRGVVREWLDEQVALLSQVRALRRQPTTFETVEIGSLPEHRQRLWLMSLVGARGIDFPPLTGWSDEQLAERLLRFVESGELPALTFGSLLEPVVDDREPDWQPEDVALELGAEAPPHRVLVATERLTSEGRATAPMRLRAARALKRRNEPARALALLRETASPELELERAGVLVRLGRLDAARKLIGELQKQQLPPRLQSEASSLLGRMLLHQGQLALAKQALQAQPPSAAWHETMASVHLVAGELTEARQHTDEALSFEHDAEQRARIEALRANHAQRIGDLDSALERFRTAAEHAARAGATLEEATYLTGVAGAAASLGRIAVALEAARRAELLFEHLGQSSQAARAALSAATAYAIVGARKEARAAAERSVRLARTGKDARCQGFAHLVLVDVLEPGPAQEQLERATTLLSPLPAGDHLRVAARALRLEVPLSKSIDEFDRLTQEAEVEERLEWWAARAEVLLRRPEASEARLVLEHIATLTGRGASVEALGPALGFAAALAAESGDGDGARRFAQAAGDLLRGLRRDSPRELLLSLGQRPWVQCVRAPTERPVSPEQVSDLETLIHSLSEREHLRPLLDQVLDALILWTGVERGLLLLQAPGGKLVPRAARNLARRDLNPQQVALSRSLAERALERGECVVAVDAAGELPELHESVHALKLRSVLAVPLVARGRALGVVYLDDRVRRGAFGPRELAWVKLVGALAAVAIADARDQLELRRAARRAARAERRLETALQERDGQLEAAERELAHARSESRYAYDEIVGKSQPIRTMLHLLDRITPTEIPVLIFGESGSGKELVARAITKNGPRGDRPFVSENCSAIPETLLESTLFGHVKGAFTGASKRRAGLFEIADGGTLFLDEIADMSLGMQAKLLRVLESGEIRRVGDEKAVSVDVRVIGATHKDLNELVRTGHFREDLLYRLNVISVQVPPLRERTEDLPLLVQHFLEKHGAPSDLRVSPEALELLVRFSWPGNVRQLENEIRRAIVLSDDVITEAHLSSAILTQGPRALPSGLHLRGRIDALEVELVTRALTQTEGNQTQAAKLLGISRFGLQKMMRRLGIAVESVRAGQIESPRLTD